MTDTGHHTATAPPTAPNPQPTPELTGAAATVYTHLTALDEAVSAAEIALAAKIGHSTTGKALNTLEKLNLAIRTPGTFKGRHRTPDLWHRASAAKNSSEPHTTTAPNETAPATPPSPSVTSHHSKGTTEAPRDTQPCESAPRGARAGLTADVAGVKARGSEAPADKYTDGLGQPADQRAATPHVTGQRGANGRLAPGGLRQMVINHLQAHPADAFTATKISRVIERSSGAIANALVTLAKQGLAEKVSEKPLTYRLATTHPAAQ